MSLLDELRCEHCRTLEGPHEQWCPVAILRELERSERPGHVYDYSTGKAQVLACEAERQEKLRAKEGFLARFPVRD